ncbi:MAG: tyrosine-type recombinase/integrase [Peptostreptococcaceae bacterium]|nr:tyrosine-type recombinase/integrase [Peptostreptococcaceae bacterium]
MQVMDVTEEICMQIRSGDDLATIRDKVFLVLSKYQISVKETSLVRSDFEKDRWILQKFFALKKMEGLADSSLGYYRTILKGFMERQRKNLQEITTDDIRLYFVSRGSVSHVTLNNERRVLRSFFQFLMEEEYLTRNPMLKIKKIKEEKRIKRPFSETELEMLRRQCIHLREQALFEFLYSTACRVGEIPPLKVRDVDFENREVRIVGKGNKERMAFLNTRSVLALKEYLQERKAQPQEPLFTALRKRAGENGISKGAIEQWMNRLGERAGIDKVHPHRMRRTTATVALKRGVPLDEVRQMLGHEDIATTTIYAKSEVQEVKRSHEKFI